jgi:hypothetical protein
MPFKTSPTLPRFASAAMTLGVICLGLATPAAAAQARYAVIAYSEANGRAAATRDWRTRGEADADALKLCASTGATDCKVVVYTAKSRHCVVLVNTEKTFWASASGATDTDATNKAFARLATITSAQGKVVSHWCNLY